MEDSFKESDRGDHEFNDNNEFDNENNEYNEHNELNDSERHDGQMDNVTNSYHSSNKNDDFSAKSESNKSMNSLNSDVKFKREEDMNSSNMDEESQSGDYEGNSEHMEGDNEYEQDQEVLDSIMPERKIRFKIFNFINKIRNNFKLPELKEDFLGNQAAMIYAAYLMTDKENDGELQKM